VVIDECGGPEAWCGGGGSEGLAKFGQETLGGRAHWRLGSATVSVHNPARDDGLRCRGADKWLREVEGRRRLASEGVGLCDKRRGVMGVPMVHFGSSRKRTREGQGGGSRLGALRRGDGEGVWWRGGGGHRSVKQGTSGGGGTDGGERSARG
jgi:hypothetical protein